MVREPTRDQALRIYRTMHLIRRFEERVAECFAAAEIPGFIHLAVGQESVPATVCALLERDDLVGATHRGHGQVLAKGAEPRRVMAELFGRATGYCRGKGGSMHLCAMDLGVLGTNGVVGANLPIAVGTALAAQVRATRQVTVGFFGDGAANTGAAHEALNLAAVWDLPVVFVCENNLYAEFTPQAVHTKGTSIAARAAAYGMRGVQVDGNDVPALFDAAAEAVDAARSGAGPTLLEAMTYRWRGHHEGDPMAYRAKDELEAWRAKDAIPRFRAWLVERGMLAADEDERLVGAVAAEVDDATEFARRSPWPAPEAALEDVHA
ncbi:MAG: thiamine pyrophosphate-dependent dehydrogenase E1 component subunit alpha [Candidatus Rokubacteria bacterium]|nr:thiamine pyrophosphate-dependent dehydrogenase E1 component subunit alpha [Candidatus Rokubacteria bacterium]